MDKLVLIQQMIVIFLLVMVGVSLQRRLIINADTSKRLSVIVSDICNPAQILASILSGTITITHAQSVVALVSALLIYGAFCVLGIVVPMIVGAKEAERKYFNLATVYTNTGFMGIPVARAILPDNAMIYVVIVNISFNLFIYTHGLRVLRGRGEGLPSIKKILNPGTIMSILALVIFWFRIQLPPFLTNTIVYMGNAVVFLSMTLLGVNIAFSNVRQQLKDARIWKFILLRMILLPIALRYVLLAFGLDETMTQAFVLLMAMPTANLPMILAEREGRDTKTLSGITMMTTIVSFVTITLLMSLLF